MAQPYIGEIRMFGGNFAPAGWAFCSGQLLAIAENDALFTLIGTTYGGDGETTFGLPDLQGRIPIHQGTGSGMTTILGEKAGVETVTLTTQQMPRHIHPLVGTQTPGNQLSPAGNVVAQTPVGGLTPYIQDVAIVDMSSQAIGYYGGSQPHDNLQPYLCVAFIISLYGIYPSQS